MDSTELKEMAAVAAEMTHDDLKQLLQALVGNSPLETLSLISSILFEKTKKIEHMDQALGWADEAISATSCANREARLEFLPRMLSRSDESYVRAARLGLSGILEELIRTGVDMKSQDIRGKGLLHEACKSGDIAVVRLLLAHEADIEAEDRDGNSALHIAAYHGFDTVARALLEKGARPAVCGGSGYTPMQWALNRGHLSLAQLLLDFKAWPDLADDTEIPLSQMTGGGVLRQIELAQNVMFPASMTVSWLDRMRFIVASPSGSDHDLELIEPGPGCTMNEPYIAISYCWGRTASSDTPLWIRVPSRTKQGGTETRKTRASRDTLQRSLEYAAARGVKRVWIDQECILQEDDKDKEDAMQNMHLVYCRAKYTLVLLGRHIKTVGDIAALHRSLLSVGRHAKLKERITGDKWFTRAWTCQEYGVTPTENLRYLVGWDQDLDRDAYWWEVASKSFNTTSMDIVQNIRRSWEFSHREIGGLSFENQSDSSALSLSTGIGMTTTIQEDDFIYTLTDDRIEEMYWWKHGLRFVSSLSIYTVAITPLITIHHYSFRFGARGCDNNSDQSYSKGCDPQPVRTQQKQPRLRMSLQAALSILHHKGCSVFSDKLAILGNLTDYPYRLYPSKAFEKQLSFSACALAMALFNGDLGPLFTNDTAYLQQSDGTDLQRGIFLSQDCLLSVANGRSAYSRFRGKLSAGSQCLVLGGKLLVEGLLWKIVPFTDLNDLEMGADAVAADESRHPVRFCFFQKLVRKLILLDRIDLLELVVASVMQRQLSSPLEMVHFLNDLQAWARNEQHWPKNIAEESFLSCIPAQHGPMAIDARGQKRKIVQYRTFKNARGVDFALCDLEPDESGPPSDLLSHIHRAVLHKLPLAMGECKVGDQTLVSLYMFDPSEHQLVFTPLAELGYEYGTNPWLHMHAKDTFWCVTKDEQAVTALHMQRATEILNLGAGGEKHLSNGILKVEFSGARLHITGTWSPRLSAKGVLVIGDERTWKMLPLGQGMCGRSMLTPKRLDCTNSTQ
jgi:hypothetical protein